MLFRKILCKQSFVHSRICLLHDSVEVRLQQLAMSAYKDPIGSVKSAMEIYAKNGITTAQDGASSKETIGLMQAADAQGKINLDIISYPIGQNGLLKDIDTLSFGSYNGRLKIGGIKLILDGSPQGKTAYLTEPYYKPPHSESDSYKGYPLIPQSEVSKWVKEYAELKMPIMAHANGDAAADMLIEAVKQANMSSDHRTIMIHAQTVREDQLNQPIRLSRWDGTARAGYPVCLRGCVRSPFRAQLAVGRAKTRAQRHAVAARNTCQKAETPASHPPRSMAIWQHLPSRR